MELQGGICKRGERRRIENVLRAWRVGMWPRKARIIKEQLRGIMATHSSTLAWRIPCTEEPGGLQSMGSHRVNWATNTFHFHLHMKTRQDIERVGFGFFSERRKASLFQGWIKGFQTCQCPWTHPQITKQAGWDGSIFRLSISFKHKKLILAIRCQSTAKCICE